MVKLIKWKRVLWVRHKSSASLLGKNLPADREEISDI